MINASDRRQAVELITEAVDAGAALYKRHVQNWVSVKERITAGRIRTAII